MNQYPDNDPYNLDDDPYRMDNYNPNLNNNWNNQNKINGYPNGNKPNEPVGKLAVNNFTPFITIILIVINALVFIAETMGGGSESSEVLLKYGAQYAPYIIEDGQWYRIFTAMFVHIGFRHIASNMFCLIVVGQYIENYFGKIKFLIIYFIAGLCGNLLSLYFEVSSSTPIVTAGASGAISGLIGSLVVLALDPETRKLFPLPRVLIGIVLLMIPGSRDVNVLAHLGGLISGFATGYTMYYYSKNK